MRLEDADAYIARLAARGLTPSRKGASEDAALVSQHEGISSPCDWLNVGSQHGRLIVWHTTDHEADRSPAVGWNTEGALQLITATEANERLEFVGIEGNVEVYRDKVTGQKLYAGRTEPARGAGSDTTPSAARRPRSLKACCWVDLAPGRPLMRRRVAA